MLAVWGGGAFKKGMPCFKRKGAVPRGEYMNRPQKLRKHSPNDQPTVKANIGVKSVNKEGVTADDLMEEMDQLRRKYGQS